MTLFREDWSVIRVPALSEQSLDLLISLSSRRLDSAHCNRKLPETGRSTGVRTVRIAPIGPPDAGIRWVGLGVQIGLTETEIAGVRRRLSDLLRRVRRGRARVLCDCNRLASCGLAQAFASAAADCATANRTRTRADLPHPRLYGRDRWHNPLRRLRRSPSRNRDEAAARTPDRSGCRDRRCRSAAMSSAASIGSPDGEVVLGIHHRRGIHASDRARENAPLRASTMNLA